MGSHAARSSAFTARIPSASAAALLVAALALPAAAGVLDPNHRVERIGGTIEDGVVVLDWPWSEQVLVAERDGELRLAGPGANADRLLATIPVAQGCRDEGLLDATWHPGAELLFVSWIQETPRRLKVGIMDLTGGPDTEPGAVNEIFEMSAPAGCERLGGALGFDDAFRLLVGTGDMGNPSSAGSSTSLQGKILRMNVDGTFPADNFPPGTAILSQGVRNPTDFVTNPVNGRAFFLDDGGPGEADELNEVAPLANFGWPNGTGSLEAGTIDPIHEWADSMGVDALLEYRAEHLIRWVGDFLVAAGDGTLTRVDVDFTGAIVGEQVLYEVDTPGEHSWRDMHLGPDGYVYLLDGDGALWRFRSDEGEPTEPSAPGELVPMLVTKDGAGQPIVHVEREAGATDYGFYVGSIDELTMSGYTHPDITTNVVPEDVAADDGSAWAAIPVPGVPERAYILASAQGERGETLLGESSDATDRPGGGQVFGCPCPAGADDGVLVDQCAVPFELNRGLEGPGNEIGINTEGDTIKFRERWECDVILLDISMEWCGPCRQSAMSAEAKYQRYKDDGFTLIHVITENSARAPADFSTIERWQADFGLTFPVLMDEGRSTWNTYDTTGFIPQYWLISKDGIITDHWIGSGNEAAIDAAIERELAR